MDPKLKFRVRAQDYPPPSEDNHHWETLATNYEEFHFVAVSDSSALSSLFCVSEKALYTRFNAQKFYSFCWFRVVAWWT